MAEPATAPNAPAPPPVASLTTWQQLQAMKRRHDLREAAEDTHGNVAALAALIDPLAPTTATDVVINAGRLMARGASWLGGELGIGATARRRARAVDTLRFAMEAAAYPETPREKHARLLRDGPRARDYPTPEALVAAWRTYRTRAPFTPGPVAEAVGAAGQNIELDPQRVTPNHIHVGADSPVPIHDRRIVERAEHLQLLLAVFQRILRRLGITRREVTGQSADDVTQRVDPSLNAVQLLGGGFHGPSPAGDAAAQPSGESAPGVES